MHGQQPQRTYGLLPYVATKRSEETHGLDLAHEETNARGHPSLFLLIHVESTSNLSAFCSVQFYYIIMATIIFNSQTNENISIGILRYR